MSANTTEPVAPAVPPTTFEANRSLILGSIIVFVLLLYHAYLFYRVKTAPSMTVLGTTRAVRRIWTAELMTPGSSLQQITAVHTLRNWNLSNAMMASASVAITFGMTSWVTALSKATAEDVLNFLGGSASLDEYKIVILIYVYMAAFFSFTQSMRYLSMLSMEPLLRYFKLTQSLSDHVEFMVSPALTDDDIKYLASGSTSEAHLEKTMHTIKRLQPNPVSAARILNLGGAWFTAGMRFVYLSFPVIMWFFSDWVFFASGLILVPALYWLDFRTYQVPLKRSVE